jgi:hypothetical protein
MSELAAWYAAGRSKDDPPFISNYAGGSERGTKLNKEHGQLAFEVWDEAQLKDSTVRDHLKKKIQPVLDALLKPGQTWPLKGHTVDAKGNERTLPGGWFYNLAYTHKEVDMDWGLGRRAGVDKMGAAILATHCLEDIWSECVALYTKVSNDGAGESGKKAYKILAALVQGRTHASMDLITEYSKSSIQLRASPYTTRHTCDDVSILKAAIQFDSVINCDLARSHCIVQ